MGDVFGAFPTYRPAGASLPAFEPEAPPLPLPWPVPKGAPVAVPIEDPGVPGAPAWPSGVAASVPRRFPAEGSGGAAISGCRFKAIIRPGEPDAPDAGREAGGGAICGAPRAAAPPRAVRCGLTASCGAGATTSLGAILRSPTRREGELAMSEGGAARAGWSERIAVGVFERKSDGGAATGSCRLGNARRDAMRLVSCGGAETVVCSAGASRVISAAGETGAGGIASRGLEALSDHATIFGSARSLFSFICGGVTTVCERLSASRGTEMIG